MKLFFDTSVLVAAVLEDHEHHQRSFLALSKANRSSAFCAAHNLVEVYATLTRFPGKQRLSAEQALLSLSVFENRMTIVALEVREYLVAIRQICSPRNYRRHHVRRTDCSLRPQGERRRPLHLEYCGHFTCWVTKWRGSHARPRFLLRL